MPDNDRRFFAKVAQDRMEVLFVATQGNVLAAFTAPVPAQGQCAAAKPVPRKIREEVFTPLPAITGNAMNEQDVGPCVSYIGVKYLNPFKDFVATGLRRIGLGDLDGTGRFLPILLKNRGQTAAQRGHAAVAPQILDVEHGQFAPLGMQQRLIEQQAADAFPLTETVDADAEFANGIVIALEHRNMDDPDQQVTIVRTDNDVTIEIDGVCIVVQPVGGDIETEAGKTVFGGHRVKVGTDGGAGICLKPLEFDVHGYPFMLHCSKFQFNDSLGKGKTV